MRALRIVDGRWVSGDVDPPAPSRDRTLVAVEAVGLNRADLLMREGRYQPSDASWCVPVDRVGFEMSGRVVAAAGVSGPQVGERVMAQVGGAAADVVACDPRWLLPVPTTWSAVDAAAMPSALLTEYDALLQARPEADLRGARVLITAATSGVGLVGLQICRALGAEHITATTRRPETRDVLLAQGADSVLVGSGGSGSDLSGPFDVALDHAGGPGFGALLAALAPRGVVVQIGRLAGDAAQVDLDLVARRRLTIIGTTFRGRDERDLATLHERLRASGLIGVVAPVVDSVHPVDEAERAADVLAAGGTVGKVVIEWQAASGA